MKQVFSCKASGFQRQYWILNQLFPESSAYNVISCFKICGIIDLIALDQSLIKLINRHDIFRMSFCLSDNDLIINIVDSKSEEILNLTYVQCDSSSNDILSIITEEVRKPFHLENEKPFRIKLFCTHPDVFYFTITFHHIICDLRTKDIISNELCLLYNNYRDVNFKLNPINISPYYSYCEEFDKWKNSQQYYKMIEYWRSEINKIELLNIPTDYQRQSIPKHIGDVFRINFNAEESSSIHNYATTMNVTPFIVLLASYYLILQRYSSNNTICIGVPLTNRRLEKYSDTAGCFVNILPIIIDFTTIITFKDLVHEVRNKLLLAHRNQEIPFETISNLRNGNKSLEINPIFQAGYTFEHPMNLNLKDTDSQNILISSGGSQVDLFFIFWFHNNEIFGKIEYDSDLFDKNSIEKISSNFKYTTLNLVTGTSIALNNFNIIEKEQLIEITEKWNNTAQEMEYFPNTCEMIFAAAKANKDRIAIKFKETCIRYGQLLELSNVISLKLRDLGLKKGEPVGIFLSRTHWIPISILGIWEVKCSYVPLDPKYPLDRIEYAIEDSGIRFIITDTSLKSILDDNKLGFLCIDDMDNSQFTDLIQSQTVPEETAYIIYTSGSTGKPKGVAISHRSLINFLQSMSIKPGINSNDILIAITTVSFDISLLELFLPLTCGAQVIIAETEMTNNCETLSNFIETNNCTILQATPSTWKLLISVDWKPHRKFRALCGGEAMPYTLMKELLKRCDELWNMYGPTETTIWSSCHRCLSNDEDILIGKPIENTYLYILDSSFKPVPVGVWGELFIGGSGVSSGYINMQELTREKFIINPFKLNKDEYIYRTGDFCRFRNDGSVEYGWREDNQVKINGHRIELDDIDNAITKYGGIRESVTIIILDSSNESILVSYIVPLVNVSINSIDLKDYLRTKIPSFMIPSYIVMMNSLPRTPNGKIDKAILPNYLSNINNLESDKDIKLENKVIGLITELWKAVLGHSNFCITDNFFDAGGTSLKIMTLKNLLKDNIGIDIPVSQLFQYPTIQSLSSSIEGKSITKPIDFLQRRAKRQKFLYKQR